MQKRITKLTFPTIPTAKKRVAAYARVSSGKDAMLHSLSAQVSYYSSLIQTHNDWEYVGVYADEAISGTKEKRKNFQRLLDDCRDGRIDLIITKSISRFARNTVTLLETVRELKRLGIDVYFEEQSIHTISADGELMITILASYAQEESRSASENQKWRIKRNFEQGIPWDGTLLGYRLKNGKYEIVPEEAEIVRRIFSEYLGGNGCGKIAKDLNKDKVPSRFKKQWHTNAIAKIIRNYSYTGNLLLQKTYRENHITKKTCINSGQLPKYLAENTHEAIIDIETFEKVQSEIKRRVQKYNRSYDGNKTYPFTGLLKCDNCGKHYRRKITKTQAVWMCAGYLTLGKEYCPSKQIPETVLEDQVQAVTDDITTIKEIIVADKNTLHFVMKDGRTITRKWKDRSRSESWTPEMREAARQRAVERRKSNG